MLEQWCAQPAWNEIACALKPKHTQSVVVIEEAEEADCFFVIEVGSSLHVIAFCFFDEAVAAQIEVDFAVEVEDLFTAN